MNSFDKYVGQLLDSRYKIIKTLGVGGMAVVFEAYDTQMKRIVAVKMLKDEISNDSQSVKRFINESRAVAMLSHPNIVSIYDVSVKDNLKYIVMERVDGITLKSYLNRKGALSVREAISYTEQILRALEHAHSKGIIHRDIKPQNILLLKNGQIKVTDFGIAKLPNAETVTMSDKAIGTVYYISPEQASGKAIDPRSDIYSLGAVMYEMITGKMPFDADNPVSVALMQVNSEPQRPREVLPTVPAGYEQLVMRAMEKAPENRFQSASQMLRYLSQIKSNPSYVYPEKEISAGKRGGKTQKKLKGAKGEKTIPKGTAAAPGKNKKGTAEAKKQSRSMLPIILGVATAFLLVAGISAAVILSSILGGGDKTESQTLTVPNLLNEIFTKERQTKLSNEGYDIEIKYQEDADLEPNTVIAQAPAAGSKRKIIPGRQKCDLSLTLATAVKSETLTNLLTMNQLDAQNKLLEGGFTYQIVSEANDSFPVGQVFRTDPAPGSRIAVGERVTLFISTGSSNQNATVPNLVGMTEKQARTALEEKGLVLGKITDVMPEESEYPKGTVSRQTTDAGVEVPTGTAIAVEMVVGKSVSMPDLTLKIQSEAQNRLVDIGLKYEITTENDDVVAKGCVIRTDPVSGATLHEGDTVTLYISGGPSNKTVAAPNLMGMTEEAARTALSGKGLLLGTVSRADASSSGGTVTSQSVAAGTVVNEGTSVNIVLSGS